MKFIKCYKKLLFLVFTISFILGFISCSESNSKLKIKGSTKFLREKKVKKAPAQTNSAVSCDNPLIKTLCDKLALKLGAALNAKFTITTTKTGDHLASVVFPTYNLSDFIAKLPEFLQFVANKLGLGTIAFANPTISLLYGQNQLAGRVKTNINILGKSGIDIDLIAIKQGSGVTVLLSFGARFSVVTRIINQLIGSQKLQENDTKNPFSWFDDSSIAVLLSTNDIDFKSLPADFKPTYFNNNVSIDKASGPHAVIQTSIRFKPNPNNVIANFIQKNILPGDIHLAVKITKADIEAFAGITNLKLSKGGIMLDNAGFYVKLKYALPHEPEIGISGQISLPIGKSDSKGNKNKIILKGKLKFTPINAGFDFEMIGIWAEAFGLKRIHFGNVKLKMDFTYAAGVPSAIGLGGEIAVGLNCYSFDQANNKVQFVGSSKCLQAKANIGINVSDPQDNYFYMDLAQLSFQTIVNAFVGGNNGGDIKVPDILEKVLSFPKGLKASYAIKKQTIGDLKIKQGLNLEGTIQSFDKSAAFELNLTFNKAVPSFKAKVDISQAINISRILEISATKDKAKGPLIEIGFEDKEGKGYKFSADFDAKVSILGNTAAAKINLDKDVMKFQINGSIFNSIEAILKVEIGMGAGSTKVTVEADIVLSEKIRKIVNSVKDKAVQALNTLKEKLNQKIAEESEKIKDLKSKQSSKNIFSKDFYKLGIKETNNLFMKAGKLSLVGTKKLVSKLGNIFDIFEIKRIYFKFELNTQTNQNLQQMGNQAVLDANIEALIFKKSKKFSIKWNLPSLEKTEEALLDQVLNEVSNDDDDIKNAQ